MNKNYRIEKKKYSKNFKLRKKKSNSYSYKSLEFKKGSYGLKSLSSGFLRSVHFKDFNQYLKRNLKKICKYWINFYPNISISKKSIGVRMGKGKGKVFTDGYYIKKGSILVELGDGIDYYKAKKVLKKYIPKLPLKFKFLTKKE